MRLLIVTQAIDQDDPILGFFHRWTEEFASKFEQIEIICLKEGKHTLPQNVRVHSIGKEQGGGNKFLYSLRFLYLAWSLKKDYDSVFVHMNPEYVMLAGFLWKFWQKPVSLWYNHPHKGLRLKLAASLADKIFFTSPYAASAAFPQARRMPAGIDIDVFKPQLGIVRNRHIIYSQGRIMPSKRVHILLEALRKLRQRIPTATVMLVGPEDSVYGPELRTRFADLIDSGAAIFKGSVPNHQTPPLYSAAGVSVNLAASGHFDKSVLEAVACGTPVILSSKAFAGLVPSEWTVPENDPDALADALERMMQLNELEYVSLSTSGRKTVLATQSLSALTQQLVQAVS